MVAVNDRHTVHLTLGSSEWSALRQRAEREHRSVANLVVVFIRNSMARGAAPQEVA